MLILVAVAKPRENELLWLFAKNYKWSILAGVLPRLAYAGFTFSQPYLVQRVLDFVAESEASNRKEIAYALISAYGISYIGLSVSTHPFLRLC